MNNCPLISIVIPVYNVQDYLDKCIESILFQDYKNIEILLIDDGSTDSSGEICDKWAGNIPCITATHIPNRGVAAVRNMGGGNARGELLMFIDSDDFWETNDKTILSRLVSSFIQKPDLDFLIFNYSQFYQSDNEIRSGISYPTTTDRDEILRWCMYSGHYPMMAWDKIIRKSFLTENNIQFIPSIQSEDIPWFAEMLVNSRSFAISNEKLYVYRRQVKSSITKGFSYKKLDDLILATERLQQLSESTSDKLLHQMLNSFCSYEYVLLMHLYPSIPDKEKKGEYRKWFQCNKGMLKVATSHKEKLTKLCMAIFGFDFTSLLLRQYVRKIVTR